ncbi:BZ3500_MvSof-1268-A1-R1_Chr7-1g09239 [Microbotryum saponariae]|uniref:BZ3500_MvSof-1268-A1-R1_Chr7-1g09239 protein n=1 Tax=Microbotryum saponariae TaxID=289078 RepID=A0A2X0LDB0_9BASI|nr:BZ3501_MvSof-1269-A2-R1_Chr7-1g08944 [Microbotryum saponariae]SDA03060.1 BZ3500_MvSof-1268-A1-R1_Chr7-1g09239 [Microbotryum saponariae]
MTGLLSSTALFFNHHRTDQQKSVPSVTVNGLSRASLRASPAAGTAGKGTGARAVTVSAKQLRSECKGAFLTEYDAFIGVLNSPKHSLTALHTSWKYRLMALTLRQRELEHVESSGSTICWAGRISDLPHLRSARVEAEFVVRQLLLAIAELAGSAKVYPSALSELPYPIPQPPKESNYDAIAERPPQVSAQEHGNVAPAYDLAVIEQDLLLAFTPLQDDRSADEHTKTVYTTSYEAY